MLLSPLISYGELPTESLQTYSFFRLTPNCTNGASLSKAVITLVKPAKFTVVLNYIFHTHLGKLRM